jgi:hypothetical protein
MYTEHASHLCVKVTPTIKLKFPSLPTELAATGLDHFCAEVVLPPHLSSTRPTAASHLQIIPPHVAYSKAPIMTRALMHQIFGHCSDDVLDTMCREQTLTGLPRVPPPRYEYDCPVCSLGKLPQFRKGKTASTDNLKPGELLHMDLAFWHSISDRMLTAVLNIIDAKTRMLWLFCTSSKKPPIHILRWFFTNLRREKRTLANICVDEDGALAGSTAFATYLRDEEQLNLETMGGYASFLDGKVERPNRTLAERAQCMLINAGAPAQDWCYATETRCGYLPRNISPGYQVQSSLCMVQVDIQRQRYAHLGMLSARTWSQSQEI